MSHDHQCGCGTPLPGAEALKLLEEHHQFPGPYMFKVIGFAGEEFEPAVRAAVEGVLGPLEPPAWLRARPSRNGRYLAVTVEAPVEGSAQVLAVYEALRGIQGVVVLV